MNTVNFKLKNRIPDVGDIYIAPSGEFNILTKIGNLYFAISLNDGVRWSSGDETIGGATEGLSYCGGNVTINIEA